jgi:class 3 adenylate cyclase
MNIRYDGRRMGMSQHNVSDYSLDALMLDVEAVVDRLGLQRFALWAAGTSGPVALAYAARHPERVSHLILWHSWARAPDVFGSPQIRAVLELADKDWQLFTETFAHLALGWSAGDPARRVAAAMRESVSQEEFQAAIAAAREFDATAFLPQVKAPTLVLHRRQVLVLEMDVARSLASGMADARLAVLEGTSAGYALDDSQAVVDAVNEFLGEGEEPAAAARVEPPEASAFRTVLFTDVEGSTALTDRLGDAEARDLLREHERITRDALKGHGGSEVKTMGDGFMASFSSATKALECAIAIQRAFSERNELAEEPIKVRIGLNAGEPIAEDDPGGRGDLFGTAVNMAARIAAKAEAGEILASNVVRELVAGKEFLFNDRGDTELRGFEDPVRVYEVRWREDD